MILDEAQRIKNWQTKTARRVKSLRSPYAFVLTGTPIENRIDELYSIVQYLDPELIGPLFRFNREFYQLDERGRADRLSNLEELRRRVAPSCCAGARRDVEKRAARPHREDLFRADGARNRRALRELPRSGGAPDPPVAAPPAAAGRVRPADDAAQLHAHAVRHAGDPRPDLPGEPQARRAGGNPRRAVRGAGPQGHRLLRMGAHARARARARGRDGNRDGMAYRLGAAAAPPRRDPALQERSGLPHFSLDRQRQRRPQPAGRQRGGERRPAVEPGAAGAAHRPRLAQEPDALGDGGQPGVRELDRARHPAPARAEAGAGRRRARRAGRHRPSSSCRPGAPP